MDVTDPMLDPNFKALTTDESDSDTRDTRKQSSKSHSKKRKSKHHKHHKSKGKKKNAKKHRRRESSEDESESTSEEDAWVEKAPAPVARVEGVDTGISGEAKNFSKVSQSEQSEEKDLMDFIPTYSNEAKKQKRKDEKRADRELSSIDQSGLHARELNPYWKNGGTGLPSDEAGNQVVDQSKKSVSSPVGDGGLSWLKKSYQRAKEQATEEGRSLEEIAAERWGSLNNFFLMLEEAESKASGGSRRGGGRHERERSDSRRHRAVFKKPGYDSDEDASAGSARMPGVPSNSRSQNRQPSWKKHSDSLPAEIDQRKNREPTPEMLKKRSRSRSPFSPPKAEASTEESDEEPEKEQANTESQTKVLTDQEMNALNAKIIKAELLSNTVLVEDLKRQLEQAKKDREEFIRSGGKPNSEKKVVTKVIMDSTRGSRSSKKDKVTETHQDGQRVRYFPDDDKYSLANMFQKEKMNTVEDENALFSRLAGQKIKPTEDYDMDDIFADKASSSKSARKEQERDLRKVVDEEKQYQRTLGDCNWCFEGKMQKNIVISIGEKCFLCVPPYQSLTEGHCLIVPMFHSESSTMVDEDVWAEIQKFRSAVVRMFREQGQDVVVFESAVYLKSHPHMYIECVPMPKEVGELAPIYFKKAIQECETEWSQNKKLIDLRGKDVRKGVPKGLPYFWVDFGLDSGFAHVIEDEKYFPKNFAQEIIGGMMELDHHLWRKQKLDDFKVQKNKVMEFLKMWGPYDWTR